MSQLIDSLTASGGTESAGFLNDIVEQLWPNISVAGAKILKDTVEPILATTLPGPLANLKFVKLDFGHVPIKFSKVDVHKTTNEGMKLDMDVTWEGVCDFELDGPKVPMVGVEKVHLKGRLSILLAPLTNIMPLIGAAQIGFINPPTLKLDFTDAANIADCFLIGSTVRNTILGIINSMLVLPNRMLVKLDSSTDYFKSYQPHLGIVRLTIGKATGIAAPKKKGVSRLLNKIIKDVPDCYVKVTLGAEEEWRTSVQKNDHDPVWDETKDFLVADYEQAVAIDVQDSDLGADDDIGIAYTTIKEILLNGGTHELSLTHKDEATNAKLTVHAEFHNFVGDSKFISASNSDGDSKNRICGLLTILVASALGLNGQRDELNPSVQITWGDKKFVTAAKTYTPGTDIFNPSFDQSFRIPLTSDLLSNPAGVGNIKISLLNKATESGSVEIPFQDVLSAPDLTKEENFDVGSGASIRAKIFARGLQLAQ